MVSSNSEAAIVCWLILSAFSFAAARKVSVIRALDILLALLMPAVATLRCRRWGSEYFRSGDAVSVQHRSSMFVRLVVNENF